MTQLSKDDLRRIARSKRKAFVAERGSTLFPADGRESRPLWGLLPASTTLAGYRAMHSEADPIALLSKSADQGVALALPWIGASAQMVFRHWRIGADLEVAAAGFAQPLADSPRVHPDVILLPLVGFDRAGNRLGQGAGYYDRALGHYPDALRVGLAWSVQEFTALPADPWDVPLDAVLTEAEWILPSTSRIGPQ